MPRVLLRRGLRFKLNGDDYVIESRLATGELRIQHLAEKKFLPVWQHTLIDALFDGKLTFDPESGNKKYKLPKRTPTVESLDLLDDTEANRKRKAEAKRRLKYVLTIKRWGITRFTENRLKPVIEKVSKEITDVNPPTWYCLSRWCKSFFSQGENPLVLIPLTDKRGNRTPKFGFNERKKEEASIKQNNDLGKTELDKERRKAERVEKIFEEEYDAFFLLREQPTVKALYDRIEARIRRINKALLEVDRLPIPAKSSIYERVEKKANKETDDYRLGLRESDKKHMTAGQGPRPTYPLERTQMDETLLPLMAVDSELFLPIGRPQIFAKIDVFSGMPVGWCVDFNAPGYLGVMNCLVHSIKPKNYVRELYPEVKNESPCFGIEDTLVLDNAKHYLSDSLKDASIELGFNYEFSPIKMPWFKSHIENFWRIINCELLTYMPGKTFSNIFQKKDYDPRKNAVISYAALIKILHIYFIDIYPCEEHKFDGFIDVPLRRWMEAVNNYPVVLPSKKEDLRVLIGEVLYRKSISQNGVEIDGLFFNSDELQSFRHRWERKRKADDLIKIKLDPHEISECYVADYENGKYLRVPAKNQDYTRNLTRYQHKVIRRRARLIAKEFVNVEALCEAKELIQRIVSDEWEKGSLSITRVKHARFLNYSHEISRDRIEELIKDCDMDSKSTPHSAEARLYQEASTSRGTSDIGSAFPLLTNEDEPSNNPSIYGTLVEKNSPTAPKPKNKNQQNTSIDKRGSIPPKTTRLKTKDVNDLYLSTNITKLEDNGLDKTDWGGDYD